jgi:hypothetical protein
MSNKNIYIVSKDEEMIKFITSSVKEREYSSEEDSFFIKTIENLEEACRENFMCDILILDGNLIEQLDLCRNSLNKNIPVLVMLDIPAEEINNFDFKRIEFLKIYDFMRNPFLDNIFYHKIKLLINLSDSNKMLNSDKSKAISHLWGLLNYTNLYVIVLDDNLKIRLANYPLLKFINIENENDAVGIDWMSYIPEVDKDQVLHATKKLISQEENYIEITNDISNSQDTVTVRWFISYVNDKTHWLFSIGVPISHSVSTQANIDTVRAYYRDVILKDRAMIKNIKEVTKQYSNDMLFQKVC